MLVRPVSRSVRMMRTAISPRFAISTRCNRGISPPAPRTRRRARRRARARGATPWRPWRGSVRARLRSAAGWEPAAIAASALQHHARDAEPAVVREREVRLRGAHGAEAFERGSAQPQDGNPPAWLQDLDLGPADAAGDAGAERFARRLLGRESGRQVRQRVLEPAAVRELAGREQAALHPLPEPPERLGDAIDLADVDTDAANRHESLLGGQRWDLEESDSRDAPRARSSSWRASHGAPGSV